MPPASARELAFDTVIPNAVRDGRFEMRLVSQPRLESVGLQVRLRAPGWHVGGPTVWAGRWSGVMTLSGELSRQHAKTHPSPGWLVLAGLSVMMVDDFFSASQ